jgi:FkbM family methyltransferase
MDFSGEIPPPYRLVQTRHGPMLANPNDFYVGRALCDYGEYGEMELQLLSQILVRPGAIVEVGANIGALTVPLARIAASQGRGMTVFEPQPVIFQNLCANIALNGIMGMRAWPWACAAQAGTVYFLIPDYGANGNFGGISMVADSGQGKFPVPCMRLQDAMQGEPVGLLKIDVEGMEIEVLKGATDLLAASRPVLYVENDRLDRSQALIEWLWEAGYRLWWHIPRLFNPDNYRGVAENIYGNVASFNMLCLPREVTANIDVLPEVTDSAHHPLTMQGDATG